MGSTQASWLMIFMIDSHSIRRPGFCIAKQKFQCHPRLCSLHETVNIQNLVERITAVGF